MIKIDNHEILDLFDAERMKWAVDSVIHSLDKVELLEVQMMDALDPFATHMLRGLSLAADGEKPKYWAIRVQLGGLDGAAKAKVMEGLVGQLDAELRAAWIKDGREYGRVDQYDH